MDVPCTRTWTAMYWAHGIAFKSVICAISLHTHNLALYETLCLALSVNFFLWLAFYRSVCEIFVAWQNGHRRQSSPYVLLSCFRSKLMTPPSISICIPCQGWYRHMNTLLFPCLPFVSSPPIKFFWTNPI